LVKKRPVSACIFECGLFPTSILSRKRKWQPTPVFLPGESHEQRSLAGYNPWVARVRYNLATKLPTTSILPTLYSFFNLTVSAFNFLCFGFNK